MIIQLLEEGSNRLLKHENLIVAPFCVSLEMDFAHTHTHTQRGYIHVQRLSSGKA